MANTDYLSFILDAEFVEEYKNTKPNWGFPIGGGNTLGEITFLRTYSRIKEDGTKERWYEVCERVVNGMYSIMKDHVVGKQIPWDEEKAQKSAREAFDRMFTMKWLPPGRGLWMMGTEFVHKNKNSTALNNCAFVSTDNLPEDAAWLMEASMLGVGVGFDTNAAGKPIYEPTGTFTYVIPDTREGWAEATALLLKSYLTPDFPLPVLDYSEVRAEGEPINGFGGKASGPAPLRELHRSINEQFSGRGGETLSSLDVLDVMNKIGRCVVAGNVRRSAEIALGDAEDQLFVDAKDYDKYPERGAWGYISNNSVRARVGETNYDEIASRISNNGEPGVFYLDLARKYGRLIDPPNNKDYRAVGTNPCSEQTLESGELCCLVETFPTKADDLEDYKRTLKYAYLYAKSVTLMPTGWEKTNQVMLRNRRIGTSMSGLAQFVETYGMTDLRTWMNQGYEEIQDWDRIYSEWLCVRESIKTTSIKPSGTVSLLAGVTPGVHWPTESVYVRRMRIAAHNPLVDAALEAGYYVEPDITDPEGTMVISFPVRGPNTRTEKKVSVWEKAALAVLAQRYWADNQVSCTFTFRKDEADQISNVLRTYEGQLKSASFLPIMDNEHAFAQLPYEGINDGEYDRLVQRVKEINMDVVYDGESAVEAEGERYCTTDKCDIPMFTEEELEMV